MDSVTDAARRSFAGKRRRSRNRDAAERRINAVLDGLRADLGAIEINTIDGEFFFRCCFPDFDETVAAVRDRTRGADAATVDREAVRLSDYYPPLAKKVAIAHLAREERLRLRDPEVAIGDRIEGYGDTAHFVVDSVSLKVWTRDWAGKDVVACLERAGIRPSPLDHRTQPSDWFGATLVNGDDESRWVARNQAAHYDHWELVPRSNGRYAEVRRGIVGAPFIKVSIGLPFQSPEFIADAFDAWVRTNRDRIRSLLPQSAAQDKFVALRTWTIALLMKQGGFGFDVAQYRWSQRELGIRLISHSCFKQDRKSLYERVPEAEYHLDVRRRSPFASPPTPRALRAS